MIAIHRPAWRSRGWMSFTVPTGQHLRLAGAGGAGIVGPTPTAQLSAAAFLATGIPQIYDGTNAAYRFKELGREAGGHSIKHMVYEIISGGVPVNAAAARIATDGSVPTATLGKKRLIGDERVIENGAAEILLFDLYNNTNNDMVVEIEVYE